jgi:hypothetical protein
VRIVHHLRDSIRALALLLGQRNNRRTVPAEIISHSGIYALAARNITIELGRWWCPKALLRDATT